MDRNLRKNVKISVTFELTLFIVYLYSTVRCRENIIYCPSQVPQIYYYIFYIFLSSFPFFSFLSHYLDKPELVFSTFQPSFFPRLFIDFIW